MFPEDKSGRTFGAEFQGEPRFPVSLESNVSRFLTQKKFVPLILIGES